MIGSTRIGDTLRAALAATFLGLAAPTPGHALEKIRLGLDWVPVADYCGFYQAKTTGLYEKAGLDVEIVPGGPDRNLPLLVTGGRLELAIGTSFVAFNMVKGNLPGVTIAAFFQKDPQSLVAHPDQGIASLADLKGKGIMVAKANQTGYWQFLKQKYGFDDSQLRPYTYSSAPFLADKTAVIQGYVTSDAFLLGGKMEKPPVIMQLADYGYDNYAMTVYGTQAYVAARAKELKGFLKATREGYASCMRGDYAEAKKATYAANPDPDPKQFDFSIGEMQRREIVTGGDAKALGIGAMTDARWANFFKVMSDAGIYAKDLDYKKGYTLDLLKD